MLPPKKDGRAVRVVNIGVTGGQTIWGIVKFVTSSEAVYQNRNVRFWSMCHSVAFTRYNFFSCGMLRQVYLS